jgi:predicted Zn-dependent protease
MAMRLIGYRTLPSLLLLLLLTGSSCTSVRQYLGASLVPFETEVSLGEKLAAQIERQQRVLRNRDVQAYVRLVANQLVTHASGDRPEVRYRVIVLDNPIQINAFALPAGFLYVYTGLLLAADNEAELAGILAHEIGHVVGRHSANQLATQLGLNILVSLALGENSEELASLAAQAGTSGALARFSRDDEREADAFGVKYTIAAGYDPRGLLTFFEKLKKLEGRRQSGLESLLSSHPATQERIDRIDRMIQKAGNPTGETKRDRFLEATASLRGRGAVSRRR